MDPMAKAAAQLRTVQTACWLTLAVTLALWILPQMTGWIPNPGIHIGDTTLPYAFFLFLGVAAYVAASFRRVETNELGGIMFLEQPAVEAPPGWHFVPLGFAELHAFPVNAQQIQFPADPEKIFKGPDDQPLPPGMYREIRATTSPPKKGPRVIKAAKAGDPDTVVDHKDDLLNVQKTIAVTFYVIWQIKAGSFFDFFTTIPGDTWEEKKASIEQQLRDSGETDLIEHIAKLTLSEVLSSINEINQDLTTHVAETVAPYGIEVLAARMQSPDISKALAEALNGQAIANVSAGTTLKNAEAAKAASLLASEAAAEDIRMRAAAVGKGQSEAAKEMQMAPADYRAGEVIKDALSDKTVILDIASITNGLKMPALFGGKP